jgi:hypothetical protein
MTNSNLNPSGLLARPYISSGAPPPRLSMPISPQNQTLAATLSSTTSPVPLFQSPPSKLNPVSVVRSQGPNRKRKNHVKIQSVASATYHQSLFVVSHQGYNLSGELEVNPTSLVSSPCLILTPGLYGSEIGGP